jgi:UDP-N-acetyl-D-mannosaminuronate dehydrogenase
LRFFTSVEGVDPCEVYIVAVPTPIDEFKEPNLNPLKDASKSIAQVLKKGSVVIYESTVYPGCTEEICVPILERISGLKFNEDFFVGYSPERINPGDKVNTLTQIIKVTSGSDAATALFVDQLYQKNYYCGYLPGAFYKSRGSGKSY